MAGRIGGPARSVSPTLLVECPHRPEVVAALSRFVDENGGNILAADQHTERESGRFYLRLVWSLDGFRPDRAETAKALRKLADTLELRWDLLYSDAEQRVVVFVSKTPHCLYDLLQTHQLDELGGEIVGVLSNHEDLRSVAAHFEIPYTIVPVDPTKREAAEAAISSVLEQWRPDLIVLARYMQVLSPQFVERWEGRLINIHHSFLPAFVGARAYAQARERGVKMIGATAHYVTNELDEGPIIEQDVIRIGHRDTLADVVRKGRELERTVLTRAVRLHLGRRVLVSGQRTIVFE